MSTTTVSSAPETTPAGNACATAPDSNVCMAMSVPEPTKEHAWLQRLAGTWDLDIEILIPGQPAMKSKGSDTSRMVGGFWLVSDGRNHEFPYECRLTLGFDPKKKHYVGTWLDSMSTFLWHYTGSVDASGRILTLETEGPFPPTGKITKFRETTEFVTPDHRVFTSSRLGEDGGWVPQLRIDFRRKA